MTDIVLQKAYRSSFSKIIKILSKFKNGSQSWKEECRELCANNQSKIKGHEQIWKLFSASISYIDIYTNRINDIIDDLKDARDSIAKPKDDETLKFKINEARRDIDKLDTQLKELKKQAKSLETKITESENNSSRNVLNCINSQKRSEDLHQRQLAIEAAIENKEESLQKKEDEFNGIKNKLYKKSKTDEINRCQRLKEQSRIFLTAFNINSEKFDTEFNQYDPVADFNRWEQNFRQNANQPSKTQLTKTQTPSDEDEE